MIREKIVNAMQSKNLAWHAEFEQAIDRLTAVGMSDALGSALFRAKYCNDRAAGRRAIHLLTHKAASRLKVEMDYARKLSVCAVKEWMVDACEKCHGTGHALEGARLAPCTKCNGTGAKQYSDFERETTCELPAKSWEKHQRRFDGVVACLMGSVSDVTGRVRELLKEPA